eukprot:1141821-Pelagomonas_calceolata.AAC.5
MKWRRRTGQAYGCQRSFVALSGGGGGGGGGQVRHMAIIGAVLHEAEEEDRLGIWLSLEHCYMKRRRRKGQAYGCQWSFVALSGGGGQARHGY